MVEFAEKIIFMDRLKAAAGAHLVCKCKAAINSVFAYF